MIFLRHIPSNQTDKQFVWEFFEKWLRLLKEGSTQEAFRMIDSASSDSVWTPERFISDMKEGGNDWGDPQFDFSKLDLSPENLQDCYDDSSVYGGSGDLRALLYFPYEDFQKFGILALPFRFRSTPEGWLVFLDEEEHFLLM